MFAVGHVVAATVRGYEFFGLRHLEIFAIVPLTVPGKGF